MKSKILAVAVSLLIPLISYGSCSSIACDGVGNEVVVSIFPISSGDVWLKAPSDAGNLNCTLSSGNNMVIKGNNVNKNIYVSILLTGIALGKPIRVRIVEGSSDCEVAYVWMNS